MKYWNELNHLENQIIKLDTLKSIVELMAEGVAVKAQDPDIASAFWYITESISEINTNISAEFLNLFDVVKKEESALQTNPSDTQELSDVMTQWIQTK